MADEKTPTTTNSLTYEKENQHEFTHENDTRAPAYTRREENKEENPELTNSTFPKNIAALLKEKDELIELMKKVIKDNRTLHEDELFVSERNIKKLKNKLANLKGKIKEKKENVVKRPLGEVEPIVKEEPIVEVKPIVKEEPIVEVKPIAEEETLEENVVSNPPLESQQLDPKIKDTLEKINTTLGILSNTMNFDEFNTQLFINQVKQIASYAILKNTELNH